MYGFVPGGTPFDDKTALQGLFISGPSFTTTFQTCPPIVDGIHHSNHQAHVLFSLTCLWQCLFFVPIRMDVYKTGNAVLPLSEVTFVLCVRPALFEGGPYRCGSLFEILYYFCSSSIAHDYVSVIQGGLVHMLMCCATDFLYSTIIQLLDHQLLSPPQKKVGP